VAFAWPVTARADDAAATCSAPRLANMLQAVWGPSAGEVYAGGASGVIVRSVDHGKSWQPLPSGARAPITAFFGPGPDDVYAVAGSNVLHTSDHGKTWRRQPRHPAQPRDSGPVPGKDFAMEDEGGDLQVTGTWTDGARRYATIAGEVYPGMNHLYWTGKV